MKNHLQESRKEVMRTFRNNANVEIVKTADNLINMQMKAESYLQKLIRTNADTKKIIEAFNIISDSQFILGLLIGMSKNEKE